MTARGFASNYRIVLLGVGVLAAFACIGVRLVHLHVLERDRLVRFVDKARRQIVVENARRGDILDARGNILATSRSLIVLGVDPQVLRPQDEAQWPELAKLIGMPVAQLESIFRTKTRPAGSLLATDADNPATDVDGEAVQSVAADQDIRWAKLSDSIDEATYDRVVALGIKGVYGNRVYSRAYPHRELAAHVVGYVNKEGVAAQGVERWADFYLRGQNGWRESEKDGKRRELAQFRLREVPATHGFTVVLSIDTIIQHMAEEEIARIAQEFKPEKASIIISDARSGFVLAMANYPTFDLNAYNTLGREDLGRLRNAAVADILEPGSTFKIIPAAGALNENLVRADSRFDCTMDRIEYKGRMRGLPKDDHRFDHPLTVTEIISHSSNRGAAQLGMLLGETRLYDYARAFGFGEYSGFAAIYPESPGMFAPPAKWSGSDITRIPMGHTVAATPLQIHYAMGVIASGGELLRPQVIREIRDPSGETIYRFGPVVRRRAIEKRTADLVASMLHRVTIKEEGTAPEAAIPGFLVAGKTGTTQKIINNQYSNRHHIGSFVGFFPANRPEIVMSIIVDDGRPATGGLGYGKIVAAPSFRRIGEQLVQYLDIKPTTTDLGRSLLAMEGGRR